MSPASMGIALSVSLLVSASGDLLVGRLRERAVATAMRDQANGAGLAGFFFVLFAVTPFFEPGVRQILVPIALLGFRLSYSLLDVRQNVIVAMIAPGPDARTRLLAARNIASGLAALAIGAIAAPILLAAGPDAPARYLAWATGVALAAGGSAWWLRRMSAAWYGIPVSSGEIYRHTAPSFGLILTIAGTMIFAGSLFRSMEPYAAAYAGTGIGIMIWASLGTMIGQPLWVVALRVLPPQACCLAAAGISAIAATILLGPVRTHPLGIAVTGAGFGIASGGLWLMLWVGVLHHPAAGHTSRRIGALTATSKAAQAMAALVLGLALDASAYRRTLNDPFSLPSLTMAGGLIVLALACAAMALIQPERSSSHEDALYQR